MKRHVVLYKEIGETPLVAIQKWKIRNPEYAEEPACYAGRLDPMAFGKLLVLLGDECKKLRAYTGLDKEYEVEVLLGVGSDTGDALGIPVHSTNEIQVEKKALRDALERERGKHLLPYPAFSSKTVDGKPLFLHALEGTLSSITIPEHTERIYAITQEDISYISSDILRLRIEQFLDKVPKTAEPSKRLGADFRINTIREHWGVLLESVQKRNFVIVRLKVACASGTYMRSLAGRIGESLGTYGLALSIQRTAIGKYLQVYGGVGWWSRKY